MTSHILLAYRRKSLVRTDADRISPARQTKAVEAAALIEGFACEWYEDVDGHRSGRREEGRPGWLNLRAQLDRPDVVGVGAYSLARIYRNAREFLEFIEELTIRNLRLILVADNIDTSTATGLAVATILAAMAQLESDLASERQVNTIAFLRQEKGRHWGIPPYGTERDEEKQLIPARGGYWYFSPTAETATGDEAPSPGWEWRGWHAGLLTAYRIFDADDISYNELAHRLNARGWRFQARDGEPRLWNCDDTFRVVKGWKLYAGDLPLGRQTQNPVTVLDGGHDPIIPPDLAQSVGAKSIQRRRRGNTGRHTRTYPLTSVAFCARCGGKLHGNFSRWRKARMYHHHDGLGDCSEPYWFPAAPVEAQVMEALGYVLSGDMLALIRAKADELVEEMRGPDAAQLQAEVARHKKRLARLTDLYVNGELGKADYLGRKREIEGQVVALQAEMPTDVNLHGTLDRLEELVQGLDDADPKQQKQIVDLMVERVEILGGQVVSLVPAPPFADFFTSAILVRTHSGQYLADEVEPLAQRLAAWLP